MKTIKVKDLNEYGKLNDAGFKFYDIGALNNTLRMVYPNSKYWGVKDKFDYEIKPVVMGMLRYYRACFEDKEYKEIDTITWRTFCSIIREDWYCLKPYDDRDIDIESILLDKIKNYVDVNCFDTGGLYNVSNICGDKILNERWGSML